MPESLLQTTEQQRAAQAWKDVAEVRGRHIEGRYNSIVRKVPSYVLTNGLGQTLAFLRAKGGAEKTLYDHLSAWVLGRVRSEGEDGSLLEWLLTQDSAVYRRATVETLAYLNWLKRFAEAELAALEEG